MSIPDKTPRKFVVFGAGTFISDIFDLIHASGGRVHQLIQNVPEVRSDRTMDLKERLTLLDYEVEVHDSLDAFVPQEEYAHVLGFLAVRKFRLVEQLKRDYGLRFETLVHPTAYLGSGVTLGEGVMVNAHSTFGPNVHLEDFSCVNRGAMLGHETRVGKYAQVGPSAAVAGSVRLGDKSYIGMSAAIIDRIHVGDWAVVGAGSVVTKDVPPGVVAYGVPARVIRDNEAAEP